MTSDHNLEGLIAELIYGVAVPVFSEAPVEPNVSDYLPAARAIISQHIEPLERKYAVQYKAASDAINIAEDERERADAAEIRAETAERQLAAFLEDTSSPRATEPFTILNDGREGA